MPCSLRGLDMKACVHPYINHKNFWKVFSGIQRLENLRASAMILVDTPHSPSSLGFHNQKLTSTTTSVHHQCVYVCVCVCMCVCVCVCAGGSKGVCVCVCDALG